MRVWMNGEMLPDATAPAVTVADHGLTVGDGVFEAIKVVDGRPFALTRHLDRLATQRRRAGAAGGRRRRRTPRGGGRAGGRPARARPDPDHLHRWPGAARLRSGRRRADGGGRRRRHDARSRRPPRWRRCRGRATRRARWPGSRPRRTPRTSSRSPGPRSRAPPRRSSPTSPATSARAPAPTSSTSSTASCARPPWRSGCLAGVTRALLLEWYGGREVDEPVEVVRGASEVFLVSTTRDVQAVSRWDDVELPAPGPVTTEATGPLARARARAARRLGSPGRPVCAQPERPSDLPGSCPRHRSEHPGEDPNRPGTGGALHQNSASTGRSRGAGSAPRPRCTWVSPIGERVRRGEGYARSGAHRPVRLDDVNVPGGGTAKRVVLEAAGWLLLVVGIAALVLPGPGLLGVFAGLALLSQQYEWAERRDRAGQGARAQGRRGGRRRPGRGSCSR